MKITQYQPHHHTTIHWHESVRTVIVQEMVTRPHLNGVLVLVVKVPIQVHVRLKML